jgi:hypothetical protein
VKIYFDNPEYDGQFLRALGYAPLGAQIGEAWVIAAHIEGGDATSWYNAWSSYADRLYELAIESRAGGHRVSARNAFLRASNYYRTAYIFMFALPVDPRVIEAYDKQTDAFQKAAALFEPPIEIVKIPYENTTLPGYFIKTRCEYCAAQDVVVYGWIRRNMRGIILYNCPRCIRTRLQRPDL